jgi:hypothetical protein
MYNGTGFDVCYPTVLRLWHDSCILRSCLSATSMIPRMLPAHERGAVLLRPVHQLRRLARYSHTHKEPHGSTEAGRHEAVERADMGSFDGVLCACGQLHSWWTHSVFEPVAVVSGCELGEQGAWLPLGRVDCNGSRDACVLSTR